MYLNFDVKRFEKYSFSYGTSHLLNIFYVTFLSNDVNNLSKMSWLYLNCERHIFFSIFRNPVDNVLEDPSVFNLVYLTSLIDVWKERRIKEDHLAETKSVLKKKIYAYPI